MNILDIALSQYGITEIKGGNHNPEVVKYFSECGFDQIRDDETAWCSAFANWVCMKAGRVRSGALNARSWTNVGQEVATPQTGDVVVFWRESKKSWKGHVAFYMSEDKNYYYVLGGNQSNHVCIKAYSKDRLLTIRRV